MCHDTWSCHSHLLAEQHDSAGNLSKLLPLLCLSLQSQVSQHLSQARLWIFLTVGRKMKEAWNRNGMGRIVWSHLHGDDRRPLSSGVPFWTQPFHRLRLDLPQGAEAWGAGTTLHSLLQLQKLPSVAFHSNVKREGFRETLWQPAST